MSARGEVEVAIEGRHLKLSNLDKVFYPATGFTKGDVIDYYIRIAPALLPHLRDRPLTLKRYPNGVEGTYFYEKRCPSHRPPWVRTEAIWSEGNQALIHFCVVNDLPTLVWAANLADLEMHTYLHRAPRVDQPSMLAFDLDPGTPADAVQCCEVALLLRQLFDRLGLASFPKTSGSKGIQVYVPLNTAIGYDATKSFARAVAELLAAERPDLVVSSMKKSLRVGKVLVDWSQNDVHKTTVCVWSLRAKDRPTVSTPLRWTEVERAVRARDAGQLLFEPDAAIERFQRDGDLFAPVLAMKQHLPATPASGPGLGPRAKHRGASRDAPSGAAPPPNAGAQEHRRNRDLEPEGGGRAPQAGSPVPKRVKRLPAERPGSERKGGGRSGSRRRTSASRTARTPRPGHPGAPPDGYLSTE